MKHDITLSDKKYLYLQITFVILAIIIPLGYVLITNHIWEDFFITFKHSKNLAEGNGLVYHPGERVHGFTSVFNTLLPAFFYWLTGMTSYLPALWLYRIVSIFMYVAAGLFILRFLNKDKDTSNISLVFFALYYLFVTKTIVFATNGQEAGFFVFFVIVPLLLAYQSVLNNWKLIGILWAGLMYTRPDGFVYIIAMSLSVLFITSDDKKATLISLFKAGLVCGAIYLPWFIFAWMYYGSPVPHTITAKSIYAINLPKHPIYVLSGIIYSAPMVFSKIFLPIYPEFGGWPYWIRLFAFFAGLFSTIYWLLPHKDRLGKYLSLFFFFILMYLNLVSSFGVMFSWYLTAIETLGIIILSRGIFYFFHIIFKREEIALPVSVAVNILILIAFTTMLFSTTLQMKVQQEVVENGQRMKIGQWLKEHADPGDSVFLEPLGYIGYFSGLKMYDFPGLVSPETVRICKESNSSDGSMLIEKLRPDWLVLREKEIIAVNINKINKMNYSHVATFDVRKEILKNREVMGLNYLLFDSYFFIYKRVDSK